MKRRIAALLVCVLLAGCGQRNLSSSAAPAHAKPESAASSAAPAPVSAATDSSKESEPAPLPALRGSFVAGYTDEFEHLQISLGQEADKAQFDGLFASLREKTVEVHFTVTPTAVKERAPLTGEQCEALLALLAAAPYKTGGAAAENPPTDGGWSLACYDAAGEKLLLATYNGAWLMLSSDGVHSFVFDGTDCGLDAAFDAEPLNRYCETDNIPNVNYEGENSNT